MHRRQRESNAWGGTIVRFDAERNAAQAYHEADSQLAAEMHDSL
jgi:hypothetical protein